MIFRKWGGGGQRPFGTFPKIHPFWKGEASLNITTMGLFSIWRKYFGFLVTNKSPGDKNAAICDENELNERKPTPRLQWGKGRFEFWRHREWDFWQTRGHKEINRISRLKKSEKNIMSIYFTQFIEGIHISNQYDTNSQVRPKMISSYCRQGYKGIS